MRKLEDMTDEQLAMLYVDGDNKAFDLLLSRNESKIFSYIIFIVHDHDTADDIFQETFMKVICRLQQRKYTTSGKFSAWVMRIAHNVIMDWYRLHKVENVVEANTGNDLSNVGTDITVGNIESQYVNDQIMNDVRHIMNRLPATQREVVFMRYYQDMSFKEIADATNVSINTALGRMRYALLNMRRMAKVYDVHLQLA